MPTRRRVLPGFLAAASAAVALLGTAACSGSSDKTASATTSTTTATAPTTAAPTTALGATTTAAAGGPTMFFPTAQAAIDHLTAAWQANDQATALQGATAIAVHDIFTQSANGFAVYGCQQGGINASTCNWRNRATGGYAQIEALRESQGWIVGSVYMDTDG